MILYALCCDNGHRFETWFGNSGAFEALAGRDLLVCPTCGSSHVVKAIMAPAVVSRAPAKTLQGPPATPPVEAPKEAPVGEVALLDGARREVREAVRAFRDKVLAETSDVGRSFPEEARRIHGGEAPERRIRGQATLAEARELVEDGIMVLPLPAIPDELN